MWKAAVKQSFSRVARVYSHASKVQKEVGTIVGSLLVEEVKGKEIGRFMDLGCGSGDATNQLLKWLEPREVILADISLDMLKEAKKRSLEMDRRVQLINLDMEYCGSVIRPGSLDVVFSNSALHWSRDLDKVFSGISQILKRDGVVACSIFTRNTLCELGLLVEEVSGQQIVSRGFPDKERVLNGFLEHFFPMDVSVLRLMRAYPDTLSLLKTLKYAGVTPRVRQGRSLQISRGELRRIDKLFHERYGGVLVTYEVIVCVGRPKNII